MANVTFGIARFIKKTLDQNGDVSSTTPLLFKSLASLIYRNSGSTVETTMQTAETNITNIQTRLSGMKDVKVYATKTAYDAAVQAGTATDVLAIVQSES